MPSCLFASDLHGDLRRYDRLFERVEASRPAAVFLGGDLLPGFAVLGRPELTVHPDFVGDYLVPRLAALRQRMAAGYPRFFVILGNDDGRGWEETLRDAAHGTLWTYVHGRRVDFGRHRVYGYTFVPPTPFLLKDWERYDVGRYVDPGCVSPEEGRTTVAVSADERRWSTIRDDLESLVADDDLERAIFLFHSPPHQTVLDRAALDGRSVDGVPLDVHVGSVAIRRFLERRQPLVSLHGHVHESVRLTGRWHDRIGRTHLFGAAHDGPELALVRFDTERPEAAERLLL